jgi:hypothetical protein
MMAPTMRTKIYHYFLALFLACSLSTYSTEKPWKVPIGTFWGRVVVLGGVELNIMAEMFVRGGLSAMYWSSTEDKDVSSDN